MAGVIAAASADSGLKTLVLDFNGSLAGQLAGRFNVKNPAYFLYDSERMEERACLHAELAASAYTMSLNLNFEQEGFLNSAIQYIGLEQGLASPSSLTDRLIASGEFRGHTADELRGKLGALRSLNLAGDTDVVKDMLERNSVASFVDSESRQAAEVAAMLLLAKVLALGASGGNLPDILIVNEANRVFANLPLMRHTNKLLTALLSARLARVFVSEVTYGLDHHIVDTSPVKILSSSLANETSGKSSIGGLHAPQGGRIGSVLRSSLLLTPNMHLLQDSARGFEEVVVPRTLPPLEAEAVSPAQPRRTDTNLQKRILETFATYDHATRGSVVGFLSGEDPPEEVQKAVDGLQADGYLVVIGKDVKTDTPLQTFRLTQKGYDLLRSLK